MFPSYTGFFIIFVKQRENNVFEAKIMGSTINEEVLKDISPHHFINDLFNVIDAGYGTLMLAIPSILLHLKRNSKVMEKLLAELKNNGFFDECDKKNAFETEKGVETILG